MLLHSWFRFARRALHNRQTTSAHQYFCTDTIRRGYAVTATAPDDDEYSEMTADGENATFESHTLESGRVLNEVNVTYKTFGELNEAKDNAIFVCHALTGNASLDSWWGEMLGPGKAFDTSKYLIICANVLGSCYGTTGPTSINPETKTPYRGAFPYVTIRDTVSLHHRLVKDVLGVKQLRCVMGGSMGGMQTLEWGFLGNYVKELIPVACGAHHHAWQIAISECQRQAIFADPNWKGGHYDPDAPPTTGLAVARQVAMVSYRTHHAFTSKFARRSTNNGAFEVENYLQYQGEKFLSRFDANSYVTLTRLMDSHDVARGRAESTEEALAMIQQPTTVVAVDSDVLYPVIEQQHLVDNIPNAKLRTISSIHGHDGFFLEQEQLSQIIQETLAAEPRL